MKALRDLTERLAARLRAEAGAVSTEYGLVLLLIALANWAAVVPQMRRIVVGVDGPDRDRLRASVREAARRLIAP